VTDLSRPVGVAASAIGRPVRRKEDLRLLTGAGQFTDDFNIEGQAYAAMVRSPHPHARILHIDAARAPASGARVD
jgi:carbon-monoxide dehydrogenase large subunit